VYSELKNNQERTFIYAEISFFEKWYNEQNQEVRNNFKRFISEGRVEFVNGGFVMADEATSSYQDLLDQMKYGVEFLQREFNYQIKTGYSIDPFGHSSTNAYIHAKLGFENLIFCRMDWREKELRRDDRNMEFIWKPYVDVNGDEASIFTHICFDHYSLDLNWFPEMFSYNTVSSFNDILIEFINIHK